MQMTDGSSDPLQRYHIKPQSGTAFTMQKGQVVRIVDVEGEQVSDLVCFSQADRQEVISSGHTTDYNGKLFLSSGDVLFSNCSNPMLTIIDDRVGEHMMLFAPCSQKMFQRSYGISEYHPNCLDNFVTNLKRYDIRAAQIPIPLNIFMNIDITDDGKIEILPPLSKAGDTIDLRAEMDLIVGVTACSAGKCNNYRCTAIDVEVYSDL